MPPTLVEPESLQRELSPSARKMRMLKSLVCGNRYERAARANGARVVAGVDEEVVEQPEGAERGQRGARQQGQREEDALAGADGVERHRRMLP